MYMHSWDHLHNHGNKSVPLPQHFLVSSCDLFPSLSCPPHLLTDLLSAIMAECALCGILYKQTHTVCTFFFLLLSHSMVILRFVYVGCTHSLLQYSAE
jgi:hypothetical protein